MLRQMQKILLYSTLRRMKHNGGTKMQRDKGMDESVSVEAGGSIRDSQRGKALKDNALGLFGAIQVAFAMGSQAFLGVLLLNILYRKNNLSDHEQFGACVPTFVFVFLSKFCLVAGHSANDFKKLGQPSWWRSWNPKNWDSHTSIRSEMTFAACSTLIAYGGIVAFVGITGISLDEKIGAANLLRSYGTKGADAAANVFGSYYFQLFAMLMALNVNLFFFPNMNKLAWRNAKWPLLSLFETKPYCGLRQKIISAVEWHRNELRRLYQEKNNISDDLQDKINQLDEFLDVIGRVGTDQEQANDSQWLKDFVAAADQQVIDTDIDPEEGTPLLPSETPSIIRDDYFRRAFTVFFVAVGSIGFSNLSGLAPLLVSKIGEIFFRGSETFAGETNASVSGSLAVMALSSTCMAVVPPLVDELSRSSSCFGGRSFIRVSHPVRFYVDMLFALAICGWGATPNTYQAVLNQQRSGGDNAYIAFAALGSVLIEFLAAYKFVQSIRFCTTKQTKDVARIDNRLIEFERDYDAVDRVVKCHNATVTHIQAPSRKELRSGITKLCRPFMGGRMCC